MNWHKLLDVVGSGRIFIQTHDYPDPDAIASAFGLQTFLAHFGINSLLCYKGDMDRLSVTTAVETFNVSIFPFSDALMMQPGDKIILVDGQKYNANMTDLPGHIVACIDHHPIIKQPSYEYADLRIVGSCSSILADYFFTAHVPMPKNVATMLLFGLHIDTKFLTRGVKELDLTIFPELYRLADQNQLELIENCNLELADLKAFGVAFNTITIFGRAGFAHIPFSCHDALIAQVADFILSLAEVDIAIVYASRPDGLKYSVRSAMTNVHSGDMLVATMPPFGSGGGHASMAGGFVARKTIEQNGIKEDDVAIILRDRFLHYIHERLKTPS